MKLRGGPDTISVFEKDGGTFSILSHLETFHGRYYVGPNFRPGRSGFPSLGSQTHSRTSAVVIVATLWFIATLHITATLCIIATLRILVTLRIVGLESVAEK